MLHCLVLAECMEGKRRFLDSIANAVWAICEESSWTWPAHVEAQKAGVDLPDTTEPVVALFSAQTANSLAWTDYLLKRDLDTVSPQLCKRIERQIDSQIHGFVQSGLTAARKWKLWIPSISRRNHRISFKVS